MSAFKLKDFSNSEKSENLTNAWTTVQTDGSFEMMCSDLDTRKVLIVDVRADLQKFAVLELDYEHIDDKAVEQSLVALWDTRTSHTYDVYPVAVSKLNAL